MNYDFRDPAYIFKNENGKLSSSIPEKTIKNLCIECGKQNKILINVKDYEDWTGTSGGPKKMVQNVFKWLGPSQVELLITGIHVECWDEIFKRTR